ncbi:MAG: hypothetical protein ACTMIY_11035 [Microbacterium gubbeenense]
MADQMTPDLMRQIAKRLRSAFDTDEWTMVGTSADALDRLADVIEYAEFDSHMLGMSDGYAEALRDTLRLARGESNERESNA